MLASCGLRARPSGGSGLVAKAHFPIFPALWDGFVAMAVQVVCACGMFGRHCWTQGWGSNWFGGC